MEETYYVKDKDYTPCVEPSAYQRDKRGRLQFFCTCSTCGTKRLGMEKKMGKLEQEKIWKGKKNRKKDKKQLARLKGRAFLILLLAQQKMRLFIMALHE